MNFPSDSSGTATNPLVDRAPQAKRPAFAWLSTRHAIAIGVVVWLCCGIAGLAILFLYENSAGAVARAPGDWPQGTKVEGSTGVATLVMFAHPHCPCTRSSLVELEKIVAHCQGKVTPRVVFFKPAQSVEGWEQSDLWKTAAAIPGVRVCADLDGEEARRFGASTSGQALLYSPSGKLLFSGGITSSRGHFGDNAGRDAVESHLSDGSASQSTTPVFGCPIVTPTNTQ